MPVLQLLAWLIVVGLIFGGILYVAGEMIPLPVRRAIYVIMVIAMVIVVFQAMGLINGIGHLGRIR